MSGPGAVDLMPSLAVPLPMAAISEVLGISEADKPDFWSQSGQGLSGGRSRRTPCRAGRPAQESVQLRPVSASNIMVQIAVSRERGSQLTPGVEQHFIYRVAVGRELSDQGI